jgi:hypothetical protein
LAGILRVSTGKTFKELRFLEFGLRSSEAGRAKEDGTDKKVKWTKKKICAIARAIALLEFFFQILMLLKFCIVFSLLSKKT